MDTWKSRGGKSQRREGKRREGEEKRREEKRREEKRREKKKKEDRRRERVRRKKMQAREKVKKVAKNTTFFHWFVAPEGRKVGSLKRRVRRHLGRWEMKNCTLLWREAHFEVKTYKRDQRRNTVWKLWRGKVHGVVARSACGRKKSKKTHGLRLLLEVAMMKKCTPLWRKAHFEVKIYKTH